LACAAARFSQNERGDALHYRFAAHMAEEKKHERLALHDLKCLGKSIEELPEHPSTRMFYEPQYFKIEHQTPLALFGYILPLEAVGPALGARVVEQVTGAFGSSCASFLKLHAAEDVDHLDKALRILDSILEEERRPIEENLRQTAFAYGCMLVDMRTRVESTRAS
jgi:hypothetical protein